MIAEIGKIDLELQIDLDRLGAAGIPADVVFEQVLGCLGFIGLVCSIFTRRQQVTLNGKLEIFT